jgi:hypothetical protein
MKKANNEIVLIAVLNIIYFKSKIEIVLNEKGGSMLPPLIIKYKLISDKLS